MTPAFETMQRESAICFPFLGSWTINPPAYITVFGRNIYLLCADRAEIRHLCRQLLRSGDLDDPDDHSRGEAVFCGLPLGLLRGASG